MTTIHMPLPPIDEYGTPTEKMPNCPLCEEDELSLLEPNAAFCNACCATVHRIDLNVMLTQVSIQCDGCNWEGRVHETEAGDDGALLCPVCDQEIRILYPRDSC